MKSWKISTKVLVTFAVIASGFITIAGTNKQQALNIGSAPSKVGVAQNVDTGSAKESGVSPLNTDRASNSTTSTPTYQPMSVYEPPVCSYISVPYQTVYKSASWLPAGQTSVGLSGINGEKKICTDSYGITTTTNLVTPLDRTIYIGTYVAPTYNNNYSGYYNVDGSYIPSPNYSGSTLGGYSPTYTCNDGTYSYAQHSQGACSYHGGVAY